MSDGEVRRFRPGSLVLVEDVAGRGHITRRVGPPRRETLMVTIAPISHVEGKTGADAT